MEKKLASLSLFHFGEAAFGKASPSPTNTLLYTAPVISPLAATIMTLYDLYNKVYATPRERENLLRCAALNLLTLDYIKLI